MLLDQVLAAYHYMQKLPVKKSTLSLTFGRNECLPEDVFEIENWFSCFNEANAIFDLKDDNVLLTIYYGDNN